MLNVFTYFIFHTKNVSKWKIHSIKNCFKTRNGILTIFQKTKRKNSLVPNEKKKNYKHIGQRQPSQAHSGPTLSAYPSSPGGSGASTDCGELARLGFLLLRPSVALMAPPTP